MLSLRRLSREGGGLVGPLGGGCPVRDKAKSRLLSEAVGMVVGIFGDL